MSPVIAPAPRTVAPPGVGAGLPHQASAGVPNGAREGLRRGSGAMRTYLTCLRWAVCCGALFGVFEWLLRPDVARAAKSAYLFARISPWGVVAGVVLEVACLLADAQLTHLVLSPSSPGRSRVLRANLTTLAFGHVVPGGTGPSDVAAYRLYRRLGVPAQAAAVGLAVRGVGSAAVLNGLFWSAVTVSVALGGLRSAYGLVAIGSVATFALLGAGVAWVLSGQNLRRLQRLASSPEPHRDLGGRHPAAGPKPLARAAAGCAYAGAQRLRSLLSDRRLIISASGWAAANWILDAGSLWVFLLAFGHATPPVDLMVAYGLANVLAAIPVTPSGLGVVEGALVSALIGFHVPAATAVFGVLCYRLVNFWLPVPAGALSWLSLRARALR